MTKPLLSVRNLQTSFHAYGGTIRAVDDISFDLGKNEIVGLVGETGCGKTATGLSIMRLIEPPGFIAGGSIELEGKGDILQKSEKQMNEIRGPEISMIFQDPSSSLNPLVKVGEQVSEGLIYHGGTGKEEARKRAIEVLAQVGIPDPQARMDDYPHQLSGGMKQRGMIARAITLNPKILIADEPTTNLDVITQLQVLHLIKRIQKESHLSVLLISHNLGVIAQMCDRVIIMYAGSIVEEAETKSLFASPKHPYTMGLIKALLDPKKTGETPKPIPGTVPSLLDPPACCLFNQRCQFAMKKCAEARPELRPVATGHSTACFLYEEKGGGDGI